MKIGICGHFGYGNLGDELFLTRWQQLFKDKAEVLPVCLDADLDYFDKFIVGGGDLGNLSDFYESFWSFSYLQKPCYVYGVGFFGDPVPKVAYKLSEFTNKCLAVYVRDEWSIEKLKPYNAKINGQVRDLLWALDLPKFKPVVDWKNCVGLALRAEYPITDKQLNIIFDEVVFRGMRVKLLPQQSQTHLGSDHEIHSRLLSRSVGWIRPEANVIYRANACGWSRLLISTRIHCTILALLQGCPVMPIYNPGKNRFDYICKLLGIKGIDKQNWDELDFKLAMDHVLDFNWDNVWRKVAVLKKEAQKEQNEFILSLSS